MWRGSHGGDEHYICGNNAEGTEGSASRGTVVVNVIMWKGGSAAWGLSYVRAMLLVL